ncbi:SufD family Fe-S cluster assembly protein [Allosphingosinicella flava]|uniref:SufD family Fe-S cluster assembly protein n=1 Tax=Allosphingosinicella flava TaxID=2771430 RepID=A0A7T2GJ18_9SPHN|nr:SufD family Fe-S cluster assembly protein [Sphingosinicella flava]QPQ54647.1 SufD family Fe-S cluster assembly protein [Sphingosinicella flava]
MLLDLPSNRLEGWRWSDLSALPDIAARRPGGATPGDLPWIACDGEGPRLVFIDGRLDESRSTLGPLTIGPVEARADDHPLARLTGQQGWSLRLGRDHAPAGIIQVIHVSTGAADHLPAEIALDADAQASIVETYVGSGWTNRLTGIRLAKSARLMLSRRLIGESGFVSLTDRATLGEGASLVSVTLAAGGADTRLDGHIDLQGEEGFAEAGGALLARGKQRHDANLVLRHSAPHGMSRQVWRSVADDQATCSVAARVEVARGAQKTDGEQSLRGLLLQRSATINAKPELEIFADDVKCAHGATVGELDRNALFYLASRGVPLEEAKALLTQAFVADAIDRIGEEKVRDAFHADAMKWLSLKALPLDGGGLGGGDVSGNTQPSDVDHPHPASPIKGEGKEGPR